MPQSELLKALKEQLVFFERGGYGYAYRSAWRPTLLLRDSPLCLNATFAQARPCRECILFPMVPEEKRNFLLPCHHIPLNSSGDTIAKLYADGTQEQLDRTLHQWLRATIQRLEKKEVTTMKTLEVSTAVSFKNILFLTDFTPASQAAFTYAVALARHFKAHLYPAHAVTAFIPSELDAHIVPEIMENIETGKKSELTKLVAATGLPNTVLVTQEDIEAAVPKWINEHGIDLIVMGTHGRKGVDRMFMGSTAEAIVRTATCPVLTVGPAVSPHGAGELAIRKILFATSLKKEPEPAVSYALSFAREECADLVVLHVLQASAETQQDWKIIADSARDAMKELVPLGDDFAGKTRFFVEPGSAANVILEYARNILPGLIVLGLEGPTRTSTHFRRGVAYKVISEAPCAVLTVR
ncbi:MAG TPA: universal stress protein [Candidatus Angelobacter sp.]